jgi:hypothetical protein
MPAFVQLAEQASRTHRRNQPESCLLFRLQMPMKMFDRYAQKLHPPLGGDDVKCSFSPLSS